MCLYPSVNTLSPPPFSFLSLSLRVVLGAPASSRQLELTPLHVAAVRGHAEVAKALLAVGASVHAMCNMSGAMLGFLHTVLVAATP